MKKRIIIILFLLFTVFLLVESFAIDIVTGDSITGEIITGKATSQKTNVSVVVIGGVPSITIISPKSQTYLSKDSFYLNISVDGYQAAWYNFDNGANRSLNVVYDDNHEDYANITLFGEHTLYVFTNNTNNIVISKNVTFNISNSLFNLSFTEFKDEHKGNSTDFFKYSFEEIQNLSNCIFEDIFYGKISFFEGINLTDDYNHSDGYIDIDKYINISSNRIEIDANYLPNFNKSATLRIYNLTFVNPKIIMNDIECPDTICKKESYSEGVLIFNVSHFTSFSAEEGSEVQTSPSSETSTIKSESGGRIERSFELNKERIQHSLKQGETKKEEIKITNTGKQKKSFNLFLTGVNDLAKISEESFELESGESKIIILEFFAPLEQTPNIYLGKLVINNENIIKEILIALEVETKEALFDVSITIPNEFLVVMPGDNIVSNIRLFEVEEVGRVDVGVEYTIIDYNGNLLIFNKETLAIEGQTNYIKSFEIPKNAEEGEYVLYVKIIYGDSSASASNKFLIKEDKEKGDIYFNRYLILIILFFMVILFLMILYFIFKLLQLRREVNVLEHLKYKGGRYKH